MRRQHTATPEQQAKAQERRARFSAIAKQIADMTEEQRTELASRMLCATIEGHPLSIHNTCLLACQSPNATIVGGFNQWRAHGRIVRKGEHGLMIWAPAKPRAESNGGSNGEESKSAESADTKRDYNFVMVTVFDVTQTEEIQEAQCMVWFLETDQIFNSLSERKK